MEKNWKSKVFPSLFFTIYLCFISVFTCALFYSSAPCIISFIIIKDYKNEFHPYIDSYNNLFTIVNFFYINMIAHCTCIEHNIYKYSSYTLIATPNKIICYQTYKVWFILYTQQFYKMYACSMLNCAKKYMIKFIST